MDINKKYFNIIFYIILYSLKKYLLSDCSRIIWNDYFRNWYRHICQRYLRTQSILSMKKHFLICYFYLQKFNNDHILISLFNKKLFHTSKFYLVWWCHMLFKYLQRKISKDGEALDRPSDTITAPLNGDDRLIQAFKVYLLHDSISKLSYYPPRHANI